MQVVQLRDFPGLPALGCPNPSPLPYTPGDQVAEDKNPKRNYNEPMSMFFIVFMVFAYFLIVNLFVGIIMDNFAEKRDELKGKVFMTPRQEEWVATMKVRVSGSRHRPQIPGFSFVVTQTVATVDSKHGCKGGVHNVKSRS